MARIESQTLLDTAHRIFDQYTLEHRFTAADICAIHRDWLGHIYVWAGHYRAVNVAKDGFPFAAAHLIPGLMADFEAGALRRCTPCRNPSDRFDQLAWPIAEVHAELVLIHPFREGNGRCARLLASLMALQLGLPPLDFNRIRGERKRAYIIAIHAALGRNYAPMARVFASVINRTLRVYGVERRSWRGLPSG